MGYKDIIEQARLEHASPEAVEAALRERATKATSEDSSDPISEATEKQLAQRADPQIDLALAMYGRSSDVLSELFSGQQSGSPVRLAVLANRVSRKLLSSPLPYGLFGGSRETTARWLAAASDEEMQALFENPSICDDFLIDLLERKAPWDTLPMERLCSIVATLHRNSRMQQKYDDKYLDGYAEYIHGAVFNAAWRLAEVVPVTEDWARALGWLYDSLIPRAFKVEAPLQVAARWQVPGDDEEARREEEESVQRGHLSPYQTVRKGLARLAISQSKPPADELLVHEDPAFRAGAYHDARLSVAELAASYERDGQLFFYEAMHNPHIWRTAESRAAFKGIAWGVARDHDRDDLLAVNIYSGIEERIRSEHPNCVAADRILTISAD